MHSRNPHIARALLWDGLILLALSGYELFTRLDAMWGPLKMFVNMAVGERIPLNRVVTYVDITIFYVPLYMLGCMILALWTVLSRRTRRICAWLIAPAGALLIMGFALRLTLFGELLRTLKLLPLAVLTALCLAHVLIPPVRQPQPQPGRVTPLPGQPPVRHRRSERHNDRRRAS